MTLKQDELRRLMVLNEVMSGQLTAERAAGLLGLSERQTRRILAAYRKEGAEALVHGNRGRRPINAVEEGLRERVLDLAKTKYAGFNHLHMSEMLKDEEKLAVGRSLVRRILLEAGLHSPRKRRPAKHRSRRARYPKEGMLLQIDGSPHDWLEGRGPVMSLIGAIDDATGTVPFALFRPGEDSVGYFLLLRGIVMSKGVPLALYHDRNSIFKTPSGEPMSLAEELAGHKDPTQFGRLMQELSIASISARSPQAKGRVERLWGTFQDRLVSEMRLAGVRSLEEANRFLKKFLPRYNRRFAVPAAQEGSAYRLMPSDFQPCRVFCFKYRRTVSADNVVRFQGQRLQVLADDVRASYAGLAVEVDQQLDGRIELLHQGRELKTKEAPLEASKIRTAAAQEASAAKPSVGNPAGPVKKSGGKSSWGRNFKLPGSAPNMDLPGPADSSRDSTVASPTAVAVG